MTDGWFDLPTTLPDGGVLDVWIDTHADNAERAWNALGRFGAPLEVLGFTRDDLQRAGAVVQLGLPPNRIDILTTIAGIDSFATAWEARAVQEVGEQVDE